jgi:hypothetical protein
MKTSRVNFLYKILISSYSLSTFSEGVILPVYAIFVQKIGGDILNAGQAMGVFLITQGLFTIFIHKFKWTSKQKMFFMVMGWFIWILGIASYLIISSIYMLFITQILTAIGNAIADPIFEEELAHHTDIKREEFEWGIFEGSKDLVSGLAAIAGGIILSAYNFSALIYLMIGTATISFFMILYYVSLNKKWSLKK